MKKKEPKIKRCPKCGKYCYWCWCDGKWNDGVAKLGGHLLCFSCGYGTEIKN